MGEVGAAYAACRGRITDLVGSLDGDAADVRVAGCPEWSVHDVVAHVAGVVDDAMAGRLDGVATDPWTAAQVEARRGRPLSEILAEWEAQAPDFEGLLDAIGAPGRQAVADLVTHEHDLRAALAAPGARDSDAVAIAFGFVAPAFVAAAAERGIPLRVRSEEGSEFGDDGGPTLAGERFALLRAMTGRRSVRQLRGMQWDGDAEPFLDAFTFGPFRPSAEDVVE
jgi:uncharacterized protein (TIGR03083 family)